MWFVLVFYRLVFTMLTILLTGNLTSCFDCVTASVTRIQNGIVCTDLNENFLVEIQMQDSSQCSMICDATLSCQYFTFSEMSCRLYSRKCVDTTSCSACDSAELLCLTPQQCRQHVVLSDSTRNIEHGRDNDYCRDYAGSDECDWEGSGWYRFLEPAGLYIPEVSPGLNHCKTYRPGWMNDEHPAVNGITKQVKICFPYDSSHDECYLSVDIEVTKCDDKIFVYNLPDSPFGLEARYCSTSILN